MQIQSLQDAVNVIKLNRDGLQQLQEKFKIDLIKIDNQKKPSRELQKITYEISNETADFLPIPEGSISSIQAMIKSSKLLVMADYKINEI